MAEEKFTPLSTEYDQRHTLFFEEFPEGPYGSMRDMDIRDEWKEGMHAAPQFTYEARGFHEGIPRQDPGAHPTHDDPSTSTEPPYDQNYGPEDQV